MVLTGTKRTRKVEKGRPADWSWQDFCELEERRRRLSDMGEAALRNEAQGARSPGSAMEQLWRLICRFELERRAAKRRP